MKRTPTSSSKEKGKHRSLFATEDKSSTALDSSPEAGCTRLQRQLRLLQEEYARLAKENRRLTEAASLSPYGYCELDRRGMILSANTVFGAMVQTELQTLQGIAFVSILPDRVHQKFLAFIHHVLHTGGAHAIDIPIISPSGSEFVARIDSRCSEKGRAAIAVCVITDISSERKKKPVAGTDAEDCFRTIAEYSLDWKMWFGEDGALLWVNQSVERLTGYSPLECYAIPDFPYPLIADGDRGVVAELFAEALRGGEERDREVQYRRKDGALAWGALAYNPIFDAAGAPLGFCASVRSIAKRKKLEEEITQANRRLEEQIRDRTSALHRKNTALRKEVELHRSSKHQLEASERKFRMLWERSLDGMKLIDEHGTTVMVNDAYCRLIGMPRDMLIGKPVMTVFAEEERAFFTSLMDRYAGNDFVTPMFEKLMRLWNDRVVWLEFLTSPFPGDDGEHFLLVIVRDITQRKRIEEKITLLNTVLENRLQNRLVELDSMNTRLTAEMRERIESEEWLRNFLLHCPIVMYIKDARARMLMANKNFESMFGMDPNMLLGKSNRDIWGPELGAVLDRQDFEVLKNAAPKEYLDTINDRVYLTTKFPILRRDLPPLLGGYVEDVTDILAEERALKLSRQFFERILNALGDLVYVKDRMFRYVLVNDSYVEFVGIPREQIIGKTAHELFSADEADMIVSGDEAVLAKRGEFLIEELMTRTDGVLRRILVKKDIYSDENDQTFIVSVIRDITELRKEEDEIRSALAKEKELNELKSRFVSMVSHEYKTPLTAILSSAELLELFRKSWNDEKVNAHLQKIKRAVETMIEMITDALFLNKIETGKLTVNPNTFELVSFCIMIADEIQACAPAQNTIEFSSAVSTAVVSLDNKLLRYIFTNLLSNAVKYSYANSVIHFAMSMTKQEGIFSVSNRGIGIPPQHLERLFEPFFRAPNIGTIPGTGLGLSIVKRCVDSLHGSITVESVENETTVFTVTLPIRVLEQQNSVTLPASAVYIG
jgi:PAS domain S-box-containing protein